MSMALGTPAPPALGAAKVSDREGRASVLADRWRDRPVVLVFLRHFGCAACTEHVRLLAPRLHEFARLGLGVVYVGNGAPHFIDGFVERNGIDAREVEVVTDPTRDSFAAAGLTRSAAAAYGPASLWRLGRAIVRGYRQGATEGDGQQQGGVVVIDHDGNVAYHHRDAGTGDHAPTADVIDAAMRVAAGRGHAVVV